MIKYMISVYIHVVSSKKKTRPAAAGSEPRQGPGGPKEVPRRSQGGPKDMGVSLKWELPLNHPFIDWIHYKL